MVNLKDVEAKEYVGGVKFTSGFMILCTAVTSFLLGFVDGYTNPKACYKR